MESKRFLRICRSQLFKTPIPDKIDNKKIVEIVNGNENYADDLHKLLGDKEELEIICDSWIEIIRDDGIKQKVEYLFYKEC